MKIFGLFIGAHRQPFEQPAGARCQFLERQIEVYVASLRARDALLARLCGKGSG